MPRYTIRHIRAGDDEIEDMTFSGITKAKARQIAKDVANTLYPDASIRWSGDARVVHQDDVYQATIGVEVAE